MALNHSDVAINQKISTAGTDVQEECSICYEPFTDKAFANDCLHHFCYLCICTWVKLRATCPLCLQPITAIIKNVRSLDDYDIEPVAPPITDVFGDYLRDFDMSEDILEYESSLEESMSMVSDFEDYEDESSGSNDNLPLASHSLDGSLSNSQSNLFGNLDACSSDEDDEMSDSSFSENQDSSCEEDEEDKDDDDKDDDDDSDENHSENENETEFYEDDDEDDYDDNDNEDDYGDDGADYYEGNLNSSDSYDEDDDDDDDYDDDLYQWDLVCNPFPSAYNLEEKQVCNLNYVFSKPSDTDDSDSDEDYNSSINTANLVYSSNYY